MKYFTEQEVIERTMEFLEGKDDDELIDIESILEEVAHNDFYIIGTYQAKEALIQYGIFEALEQIVDEGMFNCEEVITSPELFASIIWQIKAEETLRDLNIEGLEVSEAVEILENEMQ